METQEKRATNGLSEQEVFDIKSDYYGLNLNIDHISATKQIPTWKVMYAINLNEIELQMF